MSMVERLAEKYGKAEDLEWERGVPAARWWLNAVADDPETPPNFRRHLHEILRAQAREHTDV